MTPLVAVLSVTDADRDALAKAMQGLVAASGDAGGADDGVIAFDARPFAADVAQRAGVLPANAPPLGPLIRVQSREVGERDGAPGGASEEWLEGFTRWEMVGDDVARWLGDADGLLVVLPRVGAHDESAPETEAIITRHSLWLMLLLAELVERNADGPVAFVIGRDDVVEADRVQRAFAREIALFDAVMGGVPVFRLLDELGDDLEIVRYFIDRLGARAADLSLEEPVLIAEPVPDEPMIIPEAVEPIAAAVRLDPIEPADVMTDEPRPAVVRALTPVAALDAPRRRSWTRVVVPAAGTAVLVAGLAAGFGWFRVDDVEPVPANASLVAASARVAVREALADGDGLSYGVRRARLVYALNMCKRPSAACNLQDVLRIGEELKRLRKPAG